MKCAAIAFSKEGAKLSEDIKRGLSIEGIEVKCFIAERHALEAGPEFEPFSSVYDITSRLFDNVSALVFIGACGIAVRAVAPLVKSKLNDPAVVVCDEMGRFAVSLLSGHAGGANELTEKIAGIIGAEPVITTASDAHRVRSGASDERNLILGIGCRRGLSAEIIERAVTIMLWDAKIPLLRIAKAATINIKKDEEGLLKFAEAHGIELCFYSAYELRAAEGEFSSSLRVLDAVGVDNVCERAACACGGKGRLILKKTAMNGVTAAVFEQSE